MSDNANQDLKIGDIVTFTNDYGVVFKGRTVTGFVNNPQDPFYGRVYITSDAPWFPKKRAQLTKES